MEKKSDKKSLYSNKKQQITPTQQKNVKKYSSGSSECSSEEEEKKTIESVADPYAFLSELKVNEYKDIGSGVKGKDVVISAKPEFDAVTTEKLNIYAMASLQAPVRVEQASRVPIDLTVVVDTSGSMSGDRIELTKVTTKFIVNNLNPGDYFSLVQYNSTVNVDEPLKPIKEGSAKKLEKLIDNLRAGGGTDLCGGLVEGVQVAVSSKSENKVSAVLLLTDGHATTIKSPPAIISKVKKVLGNKAVSIFCFGFGADHDAQLLKKISESANGLYYFIEKEADIGTAFGDCLGGLISMVCQKMILTIEPAPGVTIKRVLGSKPPKQQQPQPATGALASPKVDTPHPNKKTSSDSEDSSMDEDKPSEELQKQEEEKKLQEIERQKLYEAEEAAPGKDSPENLFLGDFYSEETRDVVFYVQLPHNPQPDPEFKIATVTLNYYNVITEKHDRVSVSCFVRRSPEIPTQQTRDLALDLQINRLTAAAAMEEAQTKDINQAKQVVTSAITRLKAAISSSDPFTQTLIGDLEEILGDMKDKNSFEKVAVAKMAWKGNAHKNQRACGDAGVTYQNKSKVSMQMKAKEYSKEAKPSKKDEKSYVSKPISRKKK